MSTTTQRTPMTDQIEASLAKSSNVRRYYAALAQMRIMEVERDEAREHAQRCKQGCINLSFAIDRIDYACGEPNEFEVSDYALHQNEEHVVQRVKEKLQAMREAIKEAWIEIQYAEAGFAGLALRVCPNDSAVESVLNRMTEALAKLQPFIKP